MNIIKRRSVTFSEVLINMALTSEPAALMVVQPGCDEAGIRQGMKDEQLEVVVAFLSGSDIFAILPTGFGKSLCYACLPFAFELLVETEEKPIVVVVTPLTAIMKDRVVVSYLIRIKLYEHHPV